MLYSRQFAGLFEIENRNRAVLNVGDIGFPPVRADSETVREAPRRYRCLRSGGCQIDDADIVVFRIGDQRVPAGRVGHDVRRVLAHLLRGLRPDDKQGLTVGRDLDIVRGDCDRNGPSLARRQVEAAYRPAQFVRGEHDPGLGDPFRSRIAG
ncbi:hypothetical protein N184_36325 [Sinorhizobium sp. GL28]|nr:hypothetical protein N184_36325 [Sinorhizobium sp. GL28]